jgi:DNA-binding IclR family transcriptional regulator
LGVESNIRVLRVLALHGGMLASSEIIRKSRLVQESVRKALIDLVSLGI